LLIGVTDACTPTGIFHFFQVHDSQQLNFMLQVRLASLDKLRLKVDAARRKLGKKGRAALASITNSSNTHVTTATPAPHETAAATAGSSKSSSSNAAQGVPAQHAAGVSASGLSASWADAAVGVAEGSAAAGLVERQQVLQHDLQRECIWQ
jgi:hypothetical protein